jgi:hypothetical protein
MKIKQTLENPKEELGPLLDKYCVLQPHQINTLCKTLKNFSTIFFPSNL